MIAVDPPTVCRHKDSTSFVFPLWKGPAVHVVYGWERDVIFPPMVFHHRISVFTKTFSERTLPFSPSVGSSTDVVFVRSCERATKDRGLVTSKIHATYIRV